MVLVCGVVAIGVITLIGVIVYRKGIEWLEGQKSLMDKTLEVLDDGKA